MSDKASYKGKRPKGFYLNQAKRRQKYVLEPGMKGFLITCNNREKECIRESYNLLNEYADPLYGEENINREPDLSDKDDDVEKNIEKEVQNLKQEKYRERRFKSIDSGANNCLFIKTTVSDPCQLVTAILKDLEEKKTAKGRFIIRLLPVEVTCRAYLDNVQKSVEELAEKYFNSESKGKTFAVNFKVRNNNQLKRLDVINMVAAVINDRNLEHTVNLNNPDFLINIDILRTVACLSVLQDYYRFKKYNLYELINKDVDKKPENITNSAEIINKIENVTGTTEVKEETENIDATDIKETENIIDTTDIKQTENFDTTDIKEETENITLDNDSSEKISKEKLEEENINDDFNKETKLVE